MRAPIERHIPPIRSNHLRPKKLCPNGQTAVARNARNGSFRANSHTLIGPVAAGSGSPRQPPREVTLGILESTSEGCRLKALPAAALYALTSLALG
jgi:hypothetical protein